MPLTNVKRLKVEPKIFESGLKKAALITKFQKQCPLGTISMKTTDNYSFDHRDLFDLCYMFKLEGDTEEKQFESFKTQYYEMYDAFIKNDPVRKKPYLDKLYDALDSTCETFTKGLKTEDEVVKMIMVANASQAFATKRNENIEYHKARYNTQKAKDKLLANNLMIYVMANELQRLARQYPSIKSPLIAAYDLDLMADHGGDAQYNIATTSAEKITNGKSLDEINFVIPKAYYALSKKPVLQCGPETVTIPHEIQSYAELSLTIGKAAGTNSQAGFDWRQYVFVNGKSIYEKSLDVMQKNNLLSDSDSNFGRNLEKCANSIYYKACMKGDTLSVAIPQEINGKFEPRIIRLKPDFRDVKTEIYKNYSWVRVHLFNWGPFKIEPNNSISNDKCKESKKFDDEIISKVMTTFTEDADQARKTHQEKANPVKKDKNLDIEIIDKQIDLNKKLADEALIEDKNIEKSEEIKSAGINIEVPEQIPNKNN